MAHVPSHLKYTDQHEWLTIEGDIATMGITDYAQGSLGDLVFVELPAKGKHIKTGDAFIVVESVKAASEVYAPISGEVIEVNATLIASPELVNSAPYEGGWICKIRASNPAELTKLLSADDYTKLVA